MIINLTPPKISYNPPPHWEMLEERLGLQWGPGIIVTYGDTIHSLDHPLPADVMVHEQVHIEQQKAFHGGPYAFAKRYLWDDEFRYKIELDAYRTQWLFMQRDLPFAIDRRRYVDKLVERFLLDFNIGEILYTQKVDRKQVRRDILGS